MKVKALTALAGAIALAGAANAGFVGVSVQEFDRDYFANYTGDPGIDAEVVQFYDDGLRVYRIFLQFDNFGEPDASDRLLQWGGADGTGGLGALDMQGASAYNVAWQPDPFFKPDDGLVFVPNQRDQPYDSWISFGSNASGNPAQGLLFGEFADGTVPMWATPLHTEDAGITDNLDLNKGDAWFQPTPGMVPVMQLTIMGESEALDGQFSFTWDVEGSLAEQFNETVNFTIGIPAPGALALLGLAGLAGTRRRRG
jgi:hypothetical protein